MDENQLEQFKAACQSFRAEIERAAAAFYALAKAVCEYLAPVVSSFSRTMVVIAALASQGATLTDEQLRAAAEKPKHYYLYKHGKRRVRKKWQRVLRERAIQQLLNNK